MGCLKCNTFENSSLKKINVEGAYCPSCRFIYYGKWLGKNALEIEKERYKQIRNYLEIRKNMDAQINISNLSKDLDIPDSIVEELINELLDNGFIYLNMNKNKDKFNWFFVI
jgi:Zn-finger nucleic acid-binding protein